MDEICFVRVNTCCVCVCVYARANARANLIYKRGYDDDVVRVHVKAFEVKILLENEKTQVMIKFNPQEHSTNQKKKNWSVESSHKKNVVIAIKNEIFKTMSWRKSLARHTFKPT